MEKKGCNRPKFLDCDMVDECCSAMWAVLRKERRKVCDFQRRQVLMKELSCPPSLRKMKAPSRMECDVLFFEFLFVSNSARSFFSSLDVSCHVFVVHKGYYLFRAGANY